MDLLPNLRSCYFEFKDENGELKKMSEIKQTKVYGVVATSFGGTFVRYDIGDMIRVDDIRDDGMPIFSFWGRENAIIIVGGYPLITEAVAAQVMAKAGLSLSDKWAFTKSFEGQEKVLVFMENTWGLSEDEAAKRIFESMGSLIYFFKQYVRQFGIADPGQLIKVVYLKRGAFLRYSMERAKQGHPMGQIKPPRIIPSERQDISDLLRRA
jgi:hypothetical protein